MNKKEFLKQCDNNILSFEVDETMFEGGRIENTVLLNIGYNRKQEKEYLESLSTQKIKNDMLTIPQFEIMLTKEDLEFMMNQLNS